MWFVCPTSYPTLFITGLPVHRFACCAGRVDLEWVYQMCYLAIVIMAGGEHTISLSDGHCFSDIFRAGESLHAQTAKVCAHICNRNWTGNNYQSLIQRCSLSDDDQYPPKGNSALDYLKSCVWFPSNKLWLKFELNCFFWCEQILSMYQSEILVSMIKIVNYGNYLQCFCSVCVLASFICTLQRSNSPHIQMRGTQRAYYQNA